MIDRRAIVSCGRVPNTASKLPRRLRRARIAMSVSLGFLTVVLCVLWLRSDWMADRLHGVIWGRTSFVVASKDGRMSAVVFRSHGAENWWTWQVLSYPVDDELSFPWGGPENYERALGFGWLNRPGYSVMRSTQTLPDRSEITLYGAAIATLDGAGPMVPHWFLVGASAAATWATWAACRGGSGWRISLRAMLAVTTLVAAGLGLVVWWRGR